MDQHGSHVEPSVTPVTTLPLARLQVWAAFAAGGEQVSHVPAQREHLGACGPGGGGRTARRTIATEDGVGGSRRARRNS